MFLFPEHDESKDMEGFNISSISYDMTTIGGFKNESFKDSYDLMIRFTDLCDSMNLVKSWKETIEVLYPLNRLDQFN